MRTGCKICNKRVCGVKRLDNLFHHLVHAFDDDSVLTFMLLCIGLNVQFAFCRRGAQHLRIADHLGQRVFHLREAVIDFFELCLALLGILVPFRGRHVEIDISFGKFLEIADKLLDFRLIIPIHANNRGEVFHCFDITDSGAVFIDKIGGILLAALSAPFKVAFPDTFLQLLDAALFRIANRGSGITAWLPVR